MKYIWRYKTPAGFDDLVMCGDEEALTGLWFRGSRDGERSGGNLRTRDTPVFRETCRWLDEYFAGREPEVKEVIKTVTDTVYVNKTVEVEVPNSSSVYFNIGEYTLSEREASRLDYFASGIEGRDVEIKVTGSADTATGSEGRNKFLAEKRAEVVKNYLVEKHGFNADKIKTEVVLDIFDNASVSRVAVID